MTDPTVVPFPHLDDDADPWGPFRLHITERLEAVADHLGRCRRSLDAEIAPDRHYFGSKARELRAAALGLARSCRDVERWLGECGALYDAVALDDDGVRSWLATCTRPAGHAGDHDEDPPPTPGERAADEADVLALGMVEAADSLRWATVVLDRHPDPEAAAVLAAVVEAVGRFRHGAHELLARLVPLADRHAHPAP